VNLHLRGAVLPEGHVRDVFVTPEGTITLDGSVADARTILDGGFLIPGLVDVHAHLALASPAGLEAGDRDRAVASARAQLQEGVLAIREPGSPNRATASLRVEDGLPRIFSAGRWLAPPGRFFEGFALEVEPERLPEAAAGEASVGGWAKVIGDWRRDEAITPNFSSDDLAEAVKRVHLAGGRVAVHAMVAETIQMAVEAGCDSIEHGTALTAGHVADMASRGITLVPTMGAVAEPPPPGADDSTRARSSDRASRQPSMVRMAWEAGVLVLAGTDVALPHGMIRKEVRLLADAGLPSEVALGAASWKARSFLRLPGIEEGAPADVVAFDRNPLEDLSALARPILIALGGHLVLEPSRRG
jgi:imidazolonepropionase-like amidohydrolase